MPLLLFISTCFAFLFLISELILALTKNSGKKSTFRKRDKGSLAILWIIIGFSLTAGYNLARYHEWQSENYLAASAGIILVMAGFSIRWIAILQLKKAFTVNVAVSTDQILKTDGLYSIVRHPAYSDLFLIMAGLALTMNTLISFTIIFVPICLGILYRICIEEKLLEEFFGDTYRNYKLNTWRIIPFIY